MENDSKFDELLKEMEEANGSLIGIEQLAESLLDEPSTPKQLKQLVSRRTILELAERVQSAKTEEDVDAIVKRFFKDVHNGKIPLHEQVQAGNRNQGTANAIQLTEMMRDTLRRCLNEFLLGVEDLKTSLGRIELAMKDFGPILLAIGNFRPEKEERMRGMISALLRLGYSGAEIKELTKSGEKYSSGILGMKSRDDER
jgi:hypothetical protein